MRGRHGQAKGGSRAFCYTPIHNVAGCPAMSVPLTWSDEGVGARQVAFFLADSSRAVLAAAAAVGEWLGPGGRRGSLL